MKPYCELKDNGAKRERRRKATMLGCSVDEVPDGRGSKSGGSNHGKWNPLGARLDPDGYVCLRVGVDHPLSVSMGYGFMHRIVWAAANGPIPDGYVIHHKNKDKTDNRIENLELRENIEHLRFHLEIYKAQNHN